MRLLYPSDPCDKKHPDEQYAEEYQATATAGLQPLLFSFEDFESGVFNTSAPLVAGDAILYRGWMLTPEVYGTLVGYMHANGARMVTSAEQYRHCHHLPQWYPLLADYTSETRVLSSDSDFVQVLSDLRWPGYFIKDYVKSLNTGSGSLVERLEDIAPLVERMRQYRGQIEGGLCVRRREDYLADTEQRYFVLHGRAYAPDAEVPELVEECARRIDSPFFSVDLIRRSDGVQRVVELGDGQVSDRKEWTAQRFVEMLVGAHQP